MKGAYPLHHESQEGKSANVGGQGCEELPSKTMKIWVCAGHNETSTWSIKESSKPVKM